MELHANNMKLLSYLCFLCFFTTQTFAQKTIDVTFEKSEEAITNPERGFYHHTETRPSDYSFLNQATLERYVSSEGITQILRVFYLENFINSPISNDYLLNMQKDFNTIRKAGVKIIVRFAYTKKSGSSPYSDAPLKIVEHHLEQLKPILFANTDVIEVFQAGFVGAWGEWYYTDHFSESIGNVTNADWAKRKSLVDKYLTSVPENRIVQLRTPEQKMRILNDETPIKLPEVSNFVLNKSRLGHHNDCFLASLNDIGTYTSRMVAEKAYLEIETAFLPIGGETCGISKPFSDCENAVKEMKRFHWSYLNIDYNTTVLSEWKTQGCYNEIRKNLGYNIYLKSLKVNDEINPTGSVKISFNLINDGFANPYNDRFLEIVLVPKSTTLKVHTFKTNVNLKFLQLAKDNLYNLEIGLPKGFSEDAYEIGFSMPDPNISLSNNFNYAIRLANKSTVWDKKLACNLTNTVINIASKYTSEKYNGLIYFAEKGITVINDAVFPKEKLIRVSATDAKINLNWNINTASISRVVERSAGSGFEIITTLAGHIQGYTDIDVVKGVNYQYRYFLKDNSSKSEYSNVAQITLNATAPKFTEIIIDGKTNDWDGVKAMGVEKIGSQLLVSKVFYGSQYANFLVETACAFKVYLDTDDNILTGNNLSELNLKGIDYMISDDTLYSFANRQFTFYVKIEKKSSNGLTELRFPYQNVQGFGNSYFQKVYFQTKCGNEKVTLVNGDNNTLFRSQFADLPKELAVRKSANLPKSSLILSWASCSNCENVIIERSLDSLSFTALAEVAGSSVLYRDENLKDLTKYYYRIYSYNKEGRSINSLTVSEKTGEKIEIALGIEEEPNLNNVVYPNPVQDLLTIVSPLNEYWVYDTAGNIVDHRSFDVMLNKTSLDVTKLHSGSYILKISNKKTVSTTHFIKQ